MQTLDNLDRYFIPRRPIIRWAGSFWQAWSMRSSMPLPPLAVLFPAVVVAGAPKPGAEILRILNEPSTVFDTPTFAELVAAAGEPNWRDADFERLTRSADRVFNLALLARGLAVVTPVAGAVALDVVAAAHGLPSVMRVHTSKWVVLLASTTHTRAPELVFGRGEGRRVA